MGALLDVLNINGVWLLIPVVAYVLVVLVNGRHPR